MSCFVNISANSTLTVNPFLLTEFGDRFFTCTHVFTSCYQPLAQGNVSKLVSKDGTPPFIRIKTSLTSSLVSLCAQGHGIFFSTPMLLKHLYETQTKCFESLNVFPVTEFQGTRKTLLLYHKNKYLNRPTVKQY